MNRTCTAWFRKSENIQLVMTISSVVLGLALGFIIKTAHPDISPRTVNLVAFPGELLMNMLKLLIIPLITSSLISGLANLDIKSCGKIGTYALLYYFTTTLLAVLIGIVLVVSIHPGNPSIKAARGEGTMSSAKGPNTLDALMDLFRNMFPENIIQACTQQLSSQLINKTITPDAVKPNETAQPIVVEVLEQRFLESTNVLGTSNHSKFFSRKQYTFAWEYQMNSVEITSVFLIVCAVS
ncbi:unnamed protein product [Dibothriocephalus latus]|uniref:Amino acid transporter n=1 Tax=Dibothriocephalus latus TaxID=60516 RepID=A0A3P7LAE3_DIBLA|nr:unnamed protein product [Dibothriocephalus latus]